MRVRYEQPNGINRFPVRLGTDVSGLGFPTAAGLFIFVPAALQGINRRGTIEHAWLGIMQSAGQFVSGVFRAVIHHWVYSPMTRETQYAI